MLMKRSMVEQRGIAAAWTDSVLTCVRPETCFDLGIRAYSSRPELICSGAQKTLSTAGQKILASRDHQDCREWTYDGHKKDQCRQ